LLTKSKQLGLGFEEELTLDERAKKIVFNCFHYTFEDEEFQNGH
jgi:hypothetical protein